MTQRSIRLEGGPELQAALERFAAAASKEVDKVVQAAGITVRGDIVKLMHRSNPSGITRTLSKPRRVHTASAPGQPPAVDTGRLVSSVVYEKAGPAAAEVSSAVLYAAWLEFGTMQIAARPAWVPAVENARPKFLAHINAALAKEIREAR